MIKGIKIKGGNEMTIDEAIKILTNMVEVPSDANTLGGIDAIVLGIEALKRCKVLEENSPLWAAKPLLGEIGE